MSLIKNMNVKEDKRISGRIFMALALGIFSLTIFAHSAYAGLGVGVAPDFPVSVTVGQTLIPVGLNIANTSTPDVGSITLSNIRLIPSCGDSDADSTTCAGAETDPGVITVGTTGTGSMACAGVNFTMAVNDPTTGQVLFTPSSTITLAQGATCRIDFTANVPQGITDDSSPNTGLQTLQIGRVSAAAGENAGIGLGTDQTTVVAQGHIIVDKVTNPSGDSTSFSFTATGTGYNNFSLTDAGAPNNQTLNAGAYTISETLPSGWSQTSATCVSSIGDTETIGSLELDSGETITCTFTNTLAPGHIIVDKVTNPSGSSQSFTFNTTGTGYNGFSLTDAGSPNNQTLGPGTYSVAEASVSGWSQTSATCTSSLGGSENPGSIALTSGETVTCTFTNTQNGHIIVDKVTNPAGDTQSFAFTTTGTGYNGFNLTDAGTPNDQNLAAGTYSVAETPISGWNQTSATCTSSLGGSENPSGINLTAGETVTCTFNNTKVVQYCSPGYWKQDQHFDSYVSYTPNQLFSSVFDDAFPGMTLVQVLGQGGGGINMLGRATVGALLNSTSMNTGMTAAQVISAFNAAYPGTDSAYKSTAASFTAAENCPLN